MVVAAWSDSCLFVVRGCASGYAATRVGLVLSVVFSTVNHGALVVLAAGSDSDLLLFRRRAVGGRSSSCRMLSILEEGSREGVVLSTVESWRSCGVGGRV